MILLPPRAPLSVYRFACWARGTFVALMVVLSRHPTYPQPVGLDELFVEAPGSGRSPRRAAAGPVDAACSAQRCPVARAYDRTSRPPRAADAAYRRIARWILDRQEADGSWGGIQPPWVYSIIALHALGYPLDHPVMREGSTGFDGVP